jgi:hypothetical protein
MLRQGRCRAAASWVALRASTSISPDCSMVKRVLRGGGHEAHPWSGRRTARRPARGRNRHRGRGYSPRLSGAEKPATPWLTPQITVPRAFTASVSARPRPPSSIPAPGRARPSSFSASLSLLRNGGERSRSRTERQAGQRAAARGVCAANTGRRAPHVRRRRRQPRRHLGATHAERAAHRGRADLPAARDAEAAGLPAAGAECDAAGAVFRCPGSPARWSWCWAG